MATIKLFIAETFENEFVYSIESFNDLNDNNSSLMPGSFEETELEAGEYEKLSSDSAYWLEKDKEGGFFVNN